MVKQKRRNRLKEAVDADPVLKALVHAIETAATSETDYARSVRLAKAARKKINESGVILWGEL